MNEQTRRQRLSATEAKRLRVNLLRAAGLAAVLALIMEALFVVGGEPASLSGLRDHGLWPYLVCLAVAVGQAISGGWPARAAAFAVIAVPVAFILAKVTQKGLEVLLDGGSSGAILTEGLLVKAALRAVEYAVLSGALAWLVNQPWARGWAHLGVGLAIGVGFGLAGMVFLPPGDLLGWVVEELVFPAGCAVVVYASETVSMLLPEEQAAGARA